jgi:hypothetical protein
MNAKTTNKDSQFDELLDHALSEYRDAEPLAGIDARILRRLQQRETIRQRAGLRWAIAVACAAALAFTIWLSIGRRTPETATNEVAAVPSTAQRSPAMSAEAQQRSTPTPSGSAQVAAKYSTPMPMAGTKKPIATQPVFPMPTPLTAQERAFMASLQGNAAVAASGADPDSSIAIAEIQIKPLTAGGQSSGGDQ